MGRILSISSQVVRGHVGLSAIVPALQRLGHEVLPVPTILLSNHPGHPRAAGTRVEVNTLMSMLEVLDANGWLSDIDAVMTGYLPTPEHVFFATEAIDLVAQRSRNPLVLVDPVLGDDPRGLYIDGDAATAMRTSLLKRADVITPNRFELSWLSGREVRAVADVAAAATALARSNLDVLATSVPDGDGFLANVGAFGSQLVACRVAKVAKAPHGTGDLLTGLYIGHRVSGMPADKALGQAVAGVQQAIVNSQGRSDLLLARGDETADWARVADLPVEARQA